MTLKGKRKTLDEFAAYLGVNRPLVNMWMNGDKQRPGQVNIKMLAEIFGPEIYDTLNIPRPNPDLHYLQSNWINLPAEARKVIRETASKYIHKEHPNPANSAITIPQIYCVMAVS